MAYKLADCGPWANKVGEFHGNCYNYPDRPLPPGMRAGRPCPCDAGSTEKMEADGYIGLYRLTDEPMPEGAVECVMLPSQKEPLA